MKHICINCKKEYENKDKRSKFCTQSCSGTYNGKMFPKRKRKKKCKNCDNLIRSGYTYCESCVEKKVHVGENGPIEERTLDEEIHLKIHKGANRYDHIRQHAQRVMRKENSVCFSCGYEKHVEVCHIKSIKDFSGSTKIKEINSRANLIHLCPNCHWEFDNKLLKLVPPVGIEPT